MGFISALFALFVIGVLTVITIKPARRAITPTRKWGAVGVIAFIIVTVFVFLPPDVFVQRFAVVSSNEGIDEGRVQLWKETLGLIRAYPIFGCGLGAYGSAFPKYKVSGPLLTDDQAHEDYLQLLAELGIVGAAILAALAGATVRAAFRGPFVASNPTSWSLSLACAGSLAAILLHSTADFNLYIPANAMVMAWVAAIATGVLPQSPPRQTGPPNKDLQVV
jgi:O-antigen ligase